MLRKLSSFLIIGLLLLALFPTTSQAQDDEINWYQYGEGMQKAKSQEKPIFIDFWARWCGPCQKMEEEVYPDEDLIQKSSEFINIKVNVDQNNDLAKQYNIESIPTLIFLNSEGEVLIREIAFMSSSELIDTMDQILNSDPPADENNDGTTGETVTSDAASENDPFWKSLIFVEIVISIFIAIGVIVFLSKTKGGDSS
ncbi:MAG: thioredoxin family protein [Thermoplasmatota archaeon]